MTIALIVNIAIAAVTSFNMRWMRVHDLHTVGTAPARRHCSGIVLGIPEGVILDLCREGDQLGLLLLQPV